MYKANTAVTTITYTMFVWFDCTTVQAEKETIDQRTVCLTQKVQYANFELVSIWTFVLDKQVS